MNPITKEVKKTKIRLKNDKIKLAYDIFVYSLCNLHRLAYIKLLKTKKTTKRTRTVD